MDNVLEEKSNLLNEMRFLRSQIKNPLSSIRTFAQLLPEKYDDREFRDEFSKVVNQDIRRLVRIIDSIKVSTEFKKDLAVIKVEDI